jgi:ParB family chromosome partitioning protein
LTNKECIEYSLIDNLQRSDVNEIDIAEGLKKLIDLMIGNKEVKNITEGVTAVTAVGLKEREIWNYLSLVNLVPELKELVSDNKITIEFS